MPRLVFLWTDVALFLLVLAVLGYAWRVKRSPALRATWRRVLHDAPAMCSALILACFVVVGLLDSMHYRPLLPPAPNAAADAPPAYAPAVKSLLDGLLENTALMKPERNYSVPLATHQFLKESMLVDGLPVRDYPRLRAGGAHLKDPAAERWPDVQRRALAGLGAGLA
ncbi:MAG: ABC transporter permease, partial [Bordetella sp.]|nr:ABC transporter permease [Bordetella sp.]